MPPSGRNQRKKGDSKQAEMDSDHPNDLAAMAIQLSSQSQSIADLSVAIKEISANIEGLKMAMDTNTQHTSEALKQITTNSQRITELECSMQAVTKQHDNLVAAMETLKDKMVKMEAYSRRDNLVFDGIPESENEDCTAKVMSVIKDKMKVTDTESIKVTRCHRLGPKSPGPRARPRSIIIKFHYYPDKETVWKAKKNLAKQNIWVREDFPQEIMEKRRVLEPIARKARDLGKRASVNVDTLWLDGRTVRLDQVHTLPKELQPAEIATPHVAPQKRAFFGPQSPCSNYHPSPFKLEGLQWDTVEQYYAFRKAVGANDMLKSEAIRKTKTPHAAHMLGKSVKFDYVKWREEEGTQWMYKGIYAKFSQNAQLKDWLLNLDVTDLIEANPNDDFWGVKLPLRDTDSLKDASKWKGRNELGKTLMKVRADLASKK